LITDLGFGPGVYEVTAEQMQKAWLNAVVVGYLESLQLLKCANNSEKLKTVRRVAMDMLHSYDLDLYSKQKWCNGKKINIYFLSAFIFHVKE
jgi:hypothetical protein